MCTTKNHSLSLLALLLAVIAIAMPFDVRAQVDDQYTQYWAAPAYYNAGAIGRTDFIHITGGSRLQWVGIKHAPQSFIGMADMPFKFLNKRWGVGVVAQQQSYGLYKTINASAQLAFKKKLFKGELSVGVQVGLLNTSFDGTKTYIPDDDEAHSSTDDALPTTSVSGNSLDLAAGIFYTHKLFWVGISSTHLNESTVSLKAEDNEEDIYDFKAGRAYYFMAGGNIPIKNTLFELQPSLMLKTDTKYFEGEVTARVRYNKFISGGVAYRYNDAVSAMIGVDVKNFFVGYAYDYPITDISKASSGSHEVFVSYNVKLNMGDKNKNKHKSIRIM